MTANVILQNGYMQNDHLFLAAQQSLVYVTFQI